MKNENKELAKTYDPKGIEERIYADWVEKGYFHATPDAKKKPYTIVIPPPNITGQLHMGHALDNTLQDILIRMKRMQGYEALWQPGTDHASIATEVKILEKLKEEGIRKEDLTREEFMEKAWAWKEEYGNRIVTQLKKLGSSCDWERIRFTMDEGCSEAVREFFSRLYADGLIYKGERIINWCPVCRTTISDAEVEYVEKEGAFWHIKYPIAGTDDYLEVATTRPETLLGDTAVAVHPEDERYTRFVGKTCILPIVNKEIPVIADHYVDREFGTGVVKITPAHDPNDFEVGQRHNLEIINVMTDDGRMNEQAGKYAGMDRYACREALVADLTAAGLLIKTEKHVHNVGTHDRCSTDVEPLVKHQWFVRMKELAEEAIGVLTRGELAFVPERFDKIYLHWLNNIRDWCISRQLWWGHRIPVWYCDDCGHMTVAKDYVSACEACGHDNIRQDEDSLDTWFSSALWPFSTMGWPEKTPEYEYFYPTATLVTGYDIIFFWVIRMVFAGIYNTGKCPFQKVLIHGLVRDSEGRKMSKSLGNGIDPLEVIDRYGADALRLTLVTGNAPGNDMRYYQERVEASRNFANKIWNASRFIMMNTDKAGDGSPLNFMPEDRWILSKMNGLVREVTENMEKFELGIAVDKLHNFLWDEFCDWYIEMVKPRLFEPDDTSAAAVATLKQVLVTGLKLLHPYMPFITEEIYRNLTDEPSIMISDWPTYRSAYHFPEEEFAVEMMKTAVRAIRNARAEMDVPPKRKTKVFVVSADAAHRDIVARSKGFFARLANASELSVRADKSFANHEYISAVTPHLSLYIPLGDLIDIDKEKERLQGEIKKLEGEVRRCEGMLANERFIAKAPAAKVEEEREKLKAYQDKLAGVRERLAQLQ
ncbi:MAG: valine--tRNA ligase [Eubacteriales bacterium]|nr:valine--tRNA ligase [Eubacteriales bacterium]